MESGRFVSLDSQSQTIILEQHCHKHTFSILSPKLSLPSQPNAHAQVLRYSFPSMSLNSLPTELYVAILLHLDHQSLMNLKLANHHFYDVVTEERIHRTLLEYAITHRNVLLDHGPHHCYICFKALHIDLIKTPDCWGAGLVTSLGAMVTRCCRCGCHRDRLDWSA